MEIHMKKPQYIAILICACLAALISLTVMFVSLSRAEEEPDTSNYLVKNGNTEYVIVYGEEWAKSAAELLSGELNSLTNIQFTVCDDTSEKAAKEIRIGITNRSDETYINAANEIGNNGFKIAFPDSSSIEIIAFNEKSATNAALFLISEYLVKDQNGNFIFHTDLGYTSIAKDSTEPDLSITKVKQTLRFDENGDFKILAVTDIHSGNTVNAYTVKALDAMIEKEEPDLVLIGGNIQNKITDKSTLRAILTELCAPMEERQIPWAHVFGPEDAASGMSLDLQLEVYSEFEYCISKKDNPSVEGVSNYFLPVLASDSDNIRFGVWGIDSSLALPASGTEKAYGYISQSQVSWLLASSAALARQEGAAVPSILFTNTPIPEFADLAESGNISGTFGEAVNAQKINSGLFSAALATKSILGIYCGYDHFNDFSGKLYGIELGYLSNLGYDGYGFGGTFETNNASRGARLIEINENNIANFTSKMIYAADYGISREAE